MSADRLLALASWCFAAGRPVLGAHHLETGARALADPRPSRRRAAA